MGPARASRHGTRAGFTLLEVIAACLIIVILGMLAIPNFRPYMRRAGEAACMANMRSINVGLRGYMQDHQDVWPQGPSPNQEQPWEEFWLAVLQPYGMTERTWRCPTIDSVLASDGAAKEDRPRVHYIPAMFGPEPGAAYKWSTQPWLIERASAHDQGALICFPDGSIKSFYKVLAEQGVR